MDKENNMIEILLDIKTLLSYNKKVLNIDDLASYTGLSKSKLYKLSMLNLIPTGSNEHIRQKFFNKEAIDEWLLGKPNVSDEFLEQQINAQLLKNKKN
ncbi:helix-turn-helix domain-containing protein [Cellulophaga sp. HaHaR_3_176]|uniref:helix-turn-helix transcriptional regulator n=1 Tax=Flavobacteriaceae TaxID=49546 RepID=UPI0015CA2746|nr:MULTISPECIES: helix-turn-helix domain-containing protein [Flavobacteriaceae]QWX83580.1 helix-turn-helix domain-containing protein [Cellulophaga sp. HaHaR_3_176]